MAQNDYSEYIAAASKKYGVPEKLIRQVISVESSGDPTAQSPTGPKGLMQVSRAVAKESGYSSDEMYDPAKNIDAGVAYLSKNLKAFKGNVSHALLGYNQGTGGAKEMLSGKRPMAEEGQKYITNKKFSPEYIMKDGKAQVTPDLSDYMTPNTEGLIDLGRQGVNPEDSDKYSTSAMFNATPQDTTPKPTEQDKQAQVAQQYAALQQQLGSQPRPQQQQAPVQAPQMQPRQAPQLDMSAYNSRISSNKPVLSASTEQPSKYQMPALINVLGGKS